MRNLDKTDCQILNILEDNCRESLTVISKKVGLSIDSVKKRLNRLQENKIFHSKIQLRPPYFGFSNVVDVKIILNSHDNNTVNRLISYLQNNPRVVEIFRISGNWDLSIVIISKDSADYCQLVSQIKKEFGFLFSSWVESTTLDSYKFEKYDLVKLYEEWHHDSNN